MKRFIDVILPKLKITKEAYFATANFVKQSTNKEALAIINVETEIEARGGIKEYEKEPMLKYQECFESQMIAPNSFMMQAKIK